MRRLLCIYALASLVPVVLLGGVLSELLRVQADRAGLAEARSQAGLAGVAFSPLLAGSDLDKGLSAGQQMALAGTVRLAADEQRVLRVRVRALDGHVVFASDSGQVLDANAFRVTEGTKVDDAALEAAEGHVEAELTRLNSDAEDAGPVGPRVVEVYQPLRTTATGRPLGVLEIYLPYDPIAAQAAAGQRLLRTVLLVGLASLWAVLVAVTVSVTRRLRRQVAATAFLAAHDPLTELPNRGDFRRRAAATVAGGTRRTAVAVFDLDRFKEVNDTLGHGNGDLLIEQLAARLAGAMRAHDTVARLGGDEFGVIVRDVADEQEVTEVLTRLRAVLTEGTEIAGLPLAVEASVGFALAPDDGRDVDTLMRCADVAMYAAKRGHLGVRRYRAADNPHDGGALALVGELAQAIENDELVLHYQPKTDVRRGEVCAVEALVRWQHPTLGLLFPDAFIPAVEPTELIDPLTFWVLERAVHDLAQIDPEGRLRVAVNVSARSLSRPDFADNVLRLLDGCGASLDRIVLEMTETALLVDPDRAADSLQRLADAGLSISIDDFGVGQTSLGYLATLPVDEVKIDKSFVLDMATNPRNAAIVRSVVELAHSLGFTVTAEGVETADSLSDLEAMRCDAAQGYLLSRPVPLQQLPERLAELSRRSPVSA